MVRLVRGQEATKWRFSANIIEARKALDMALDPNEAAKRALIAYRQLSEMVKDDVGVASAKAHVESYNRILNSLNQCFAVDPAFSEAVKHLRHLHPAAKMLSFQMESDGRVLLATAHAFIELYLSPEDKRKAIGFHT